MYRIAVLGDYDSIYGFSSLGLDIFPVTDNDQAAQQLKDLSQGNYAIIYITEAFASALAGEIDKLSVGMLPAIIPIPGISGNTGIGIANVKNYVEQAVGSDIIFNDEN